MSYGIFEGLSKGGKHLLLLGIAFLLHTHEYVTIMLLISLETLLPLFFISECPQVLLGFTQKFSNEIIVANICFLLLITVSIITMLLLIFQPHLFSYYGCDSWLVFLAIIVSALLCTYCRFIAFVKQIEENHNTAIKYKSIPFFSAFLCTCIGLLVAKSHIVGFFVGQAAGYCIALAILEWRFKFFRICLSPNLSFLRAYIKGGKFILLINLFGWLSSYGFINFVNIGGSKHEMFSISLTLNAFIIFLVLANSISQVYLPHLKTLFMRSPIKAYQLSLKINAVYIAVAVATAMLLFALKYFMPLGSLSPKINYILWATLIFGILSGYYAFNPYVYLYQRYKLYFSITILCETLAFLLFLITRQKYSIGMVYILITIHAIRTAASFCCAVPPNIPRTLIQWFYARVGAIIKPARTSQ